jgi:G:T-mismatch repair DNA endonuclease (very short patch repair protein)
MGLRAPSNERVCERVLVVWECAARSTCAGGTAVVRLPTLTST